MMANESVEALKKEWENAKSAYEYAQEAQGRAYEKQRQCEEDLIAGLLNLFETNKEYFCPNCGVPALFKKNIGRMNAVTYYMECPTCGLRLRSTGYKKFTLLEWYEFCNKISGMKHES